MSYAKICNQYETIVRKYFPRLFSILQNMQCNLLGSWRKNKGVVTVHVVSKIVYNHKLENSIQNLIIYAIWHLKRLTPNKLYNAHPSKTYKFQNVSLLFTQYSPPGKILIS